MAKPPTGINGEIVEEFVAVSGFGKTIFCDRIISPQGPKRALLFHSNQLATKKATLFHLVDELSPNLQLMMSCSWLPDLERVRQLLPDGAAPARPGRAPLPPAHTEGRGGGGAPLLHVDSICESGTCFTPLEWAAHSGHAMIVKYLVDGARARVQTGTPMLWACQGGHLDVAQWLVARGADPAATTYGDARCAVHAAAGAGRLACLQWLVQHQGQGLRARDASGRDGMAHALAAEVGGGGVADTQHWIRQQLDTTVCAAKESCGVRCSPVRRHPESAACGAQRAAGPVTPARPLPSAGMPSHARQMSPERSRDQGMPCVHCGKAGAFSKCSICKQAHYCDRSCQAAAWRAHKLVCKQRAAAAASNRKSPI